MEAMRGSKRPGQTPSSWSFGCRIGARVSRFASELEAVGDKGSSRRESFFSLDTLLESRASCWRLAWTLALSLGREDERESEAPGGTPGASLFLSQESRALLETLLEPRSLSLSRIARFAGDPPGASLSLSQESRSLLETTLSLSLSLFLSLFVSMMEDRRWMMEHQRWIIHEK